MKKVAVVYWSGTGNTEIMAEKIVEGAKEVGHQVDLFAPDDFKPDMVSGYETIALGCSSMGDEVLEEDVFQPMYDAIKPNLRGKSVALFGSYGWGDGLWMREWDEDIKDAGASLICESLIINETPDSSGEETCIEFGKAL